MGKKEKSTDKKKILFKLVIIPFLFLLVIFHLLSGYLLSAKLWGIHHLFYFPFSWGIILTLLTLSVFVPKVNPIWLSLLERIFGIIGQFLSKFNKHKIYIGAGVISLFIFWAFRTRLHLLGDGYLKLRLLPQGKLGMAEWLNDVIHVELFHFLSSRIEWWNPALTYSSISIVCGGLFVVVVLYLSDLLGKSNFDKLFIGALFFSLASLELFFGYVEAYTIFNLALITYILVAVLYLKGKVGLFLPLAALILSSLFHVFGLVFIPSFLYLLWQDKKPGKKFSSEPIHLLFLASVVLLVILKAYQVFTFTGEFHKKMIILPLFPTPDYHFSMFCWGHFLEFFNQLLLISPVGMILFFFFIKDSFKSRDKITIFLLSGTVFSLGFIFAFNSLLGTADWDLRTFPGVFFAPLGAILFISRAGEWKDFKNYALILIFVSFFHLIPWILLHTDQRRSIEHYKLVQLYDPHPQDFTNYNVFKIARILGMAGFPEEAEKVYKEGIALYPDDPKNYYNLARHYQKDGKYQEAVQMAKKALDLDPQYSKAYVIMGKIFDQENQLDSAAFYYLKSLPSLSQNVDFIKNLCRIYQELGRLDQLQEYFENLVQNAPEVLEFHKNLGILYFFKKDYPRAKKEWEAALRLKPDDSFCIFWLNNLRRMEQK